MFTFKTDTDISTPLMEESSNADASIPTTEVRSNAYVSTLIMEVIIQM